jgi:hypothetical protein
VLDQLQDASFGIKDLTGTINGIMYADFPGLSVLPPSEALHLLQNSADTITASKLLLRQAAGRFTGGASDQQQLLERMQPLGAGHADLAEYMWKKHTYRGHGAPTDKPTLFDMSPMEEMRSDATKQVSL